MSILDGVIKINRGLLVYAEFDVHRQVAYFTPIVVGDERVIGQAVRTRRRLARAIGTDDGSLGGPLGSN